jgi:hypothetical protein
MDMFANFCSLVDPLYFNHHEFDFPNKQHLCEKLVKKTNTNVINSWSWSHGHDI